MSIRFKFRSDAAGYDAVDTGGRPSLTVQELWRAIVWRKNLRSTYQNFDLVFYDEESGLEYDDERNEVPSGSTVIIKRAPLGTARYKKGPIDAVGSCRVTGLYTTNSANDPMFCINHHLTRLATDFGPEDEEDAIAAALRSESLKVHEGGERKVNIAVEARAEEQMNLQKTPATKEISLPSEFKCSLCKANLRQAVMIPCCQHSFCYTCISQVLVEKGRCPNCLSDKCKVENLLPNLSLRIAVAHFHEYQILQSAPEYGFNRYIPDGESGTHGIDASRAVTVIQRKSELPPSPTGTQKGSNVIVPESFHISDFRTAERGILAPNMQKGEHIVLQRNNYDEAASTCNGNRDMWVDVGGRQYTGNRTCYMCGSVGHFYHHCPYYSGSGNPLFFNRAVHPPSGFFPNGYGYPSMMPFSAPPMYCGFPTGGMMRSGPFPTPEVNRAQYMPTDSDAGLKRRKVSPDCFGREHGKETWSKHHDESSRRWCDKRQQSRSGSSQGRHHHSGKEARARPRVDYHNESHRNRSSSSDRRRGQKDRDSGLERRSSHETKHKKGHPPDSKGHGKFFR